MPQDLRALALDASTRAHSPYSNAKVGSAIETTDGKIYQGCNIENASFGGTVCAERVAMWKAVSEGHKKIKRIYVYTKDGWPPCGMCLQVMTEFADGNLEVTMGDEKGKEIVKKLRELLPNAFTPIHME
jgi:cytidine deaminase